MAFQIHENDRAKTVIVHHPGMEALFGSLHASGSLFEKPVNIGKARQDHANFVKAMQRHDIQVHNVREILAEGCETNLRLRVELEDLAMSMLHYITTEGGVPLSSKQQQLLSDKYKRECLAALSTKDLVDIIFTNPSVSLSPSPVNTPLCTEQLTMKPLLNLSFTRDQQIVTAKGLVLGYLSPPQRAPEHKIMKYCWTKLGYDIVGEIQEPGRLEGGDFFPVGPDLCMIGCGLRTNEEGIRQMMQNDMLGTTRVAVVRDLFDRSQQRMHLDTIFNIANEDCVVLLETTIGKDSPIRRLVTEYVRDESVPLGYRVSKNDVEFSEYLKSEGYNIIPIPDKNQREYGINFLNLGGGYIISVHQETARLILDHPAFSGNIEVIDFSGMQTMYGSVHCCSQVFRVPTPSRTSVSLTQMISPPMASSPGTGTTSAKRQSTSKILMHVPVHFGPNVEAAADNTFISMDHDYPKQVEKDARAEFAALHAKFVAAGIDVNVQGQWSLEHNPDEVFPNNWFSTHVSPETAESKVILYPMKCVSRRSERKENIISMLKENYGSVQDLSNFEAQDVYLEGTGSLVLDRVNSVCYMCISERSNEKVLQAWQEMTGYSDLVTFSAIAQGKPIYHTNVVMSVGTSFAVLCADAIPDDKERKAVIASLEKTGHTVIIITVDQMNNFCGNCLEVQSRDGRRFVAMSECAYEHFTGEQKKLFLEHVDDIIHSPIPNIEKYGGGSVRCMMAELF